MIVAWGTLLLLLLLYKSVHVFEVKQGEICIVTRFNQPHALISKPGYHYILAGLFLKRLQCPDKMRFRIKDIRAMTNNFDRITLTVIVTFARKEGVPKSLEDVQDFVNSEVRVATITHFKTLQRISDNNTNTIMKLVQPRLDEIHISIIKMEVEDIT